MPRSNDTQGFWIFEWDEKSATFVPGSRWSDEDGCFVVTLQMRIPASITDEASVENYVKQNPDLVERAEKITIPDNPGIRWERGLPHHSLSKALMDHIAELDFKYGDRFCWKTGGDGDNGETLMYLMDSWFERKNFVERQSDVSGHALELAGACMLLRLALMRAYSHSDTEDGLRADVGKTEVANLWSKAVSIINGEELSKEKANE